MINLTFPKLNKALLKDTKDYPDGDPRKGIAVINQHAIIFRNDFCLVVDLYEYFTLDCDIDNRDELEDLESILFLMEGKLFNDKYWNELTAGANMEVRNGMLYIETPKYAKELHHKEVDVSFYEPLKNLIALDKMKDNLVSSIAIPFQSLKLIYDTLTALFKSDYIVLDFIAQNKPVKFTFKNRKHFFGYIMPEYDAAVESFKYDNLESFVRNETVNAIFKESSPVLPPPPSKENVEITKDQGNLFGGEISKHYE
jgi:hypothetical protein